MWEWFINVISCVIVAALFNVTLLRTNINKLQRGIVYYTAIIKLSLYTDIYVNYVLEYLKWYDKLMIKTISEG